MLHNLISFVALCFIFISIDQVIADDSMTMEIELSGPNDPCGKYTKNGGHLKITHARVTISNQDTPEYGNVFKHRVDGNVLCQVKSFKDYKYTLTCNGKRPEAGNQRYFFQFAVTTDRQMLSGPIDYRYNENMSKLVANGFLNPKNLKNQKFEHDGHMHIRWVKINGVLSVPVTIDLEDCHVQFPHRLIADHGYYMVAYREPLHHIQRMYYEPFLNIDYILYGSTNW